HVGPKIARQVKPLNVSFLIVAQPATVLQFCTAVAAPCALNPSAAAAPPPTSVSIPASMAGGILPFESMIGFSPAEAAPQVLLPSASEIYPADVDQLEGRPC
ncbi:hypothetical protein ACS0Y6_36985, partial [Burkholderia gladioli]|uniref:hypothetical protein n=1 Tax=Burkholderia gladioli TaxID=28095 RepID=UPI003F79A07C